MFRYWPLTSKTLWWTWHLYSCFTRTIILPNAVKRHFYVLFVIVCAYFTRLCTRSRPSLRGHVHLTVLSSVKRTLDSYSKCWKIFCRACGERDACADHVMLLVPKTFKGKPKKVAAQAELVLRSLQPLLAPKEAKRSAGSVFFMLGNRQFSKLHVRNLLPYSRQQSGS